MAVLLYFKAVFGEVQLAVHSMQRFDNATASSKIIWNISKKD